MEHINENVLSLAKLWQENELCCDAGPFMMKDSLHYPHYLKKTRVDNSMSIFDESNREHKRLVYLSNKEVRSNCLEHAVRPDPSALKRLCKFSKEELLVQERLLHPYRNDADAVAALSARVLKSQLENEAQLLQDKVDVTAKRNALSTYCPPHNEQPKQFSPVRSRNSTIVSRPGNLKLENARLRKQWWLVIVATIRRMAHLTHLLEQNQTSMKRRHAAIRLQHAWVNFKQRFKKFDHMHLLDVIAMQRKSNACDVIIKSIGELAKSIKHITLKFVRKAKVLQRCIRRHLLTTAARIELLSRLLDTIMPTLLLHITVVLSNCGLDLTRGMQQIDINMMKRQWKATGTAASLRIVASMETKEFHAFLRQRSDMLRPIQVWSATSRLALNPVVKRKELGILVTNRRFRFVRNQIESIESLNFPLMSIGDAKLFMIHGKDKLADSIEIYTQRKEAGSKVRLLKRLLIKPPPLETYKYILRDVTAEDMVLLLINIAEQKPVAPGRRLSSFGNPSRHSRNHRSSIIVRPSSLGVGNNSAVTTRASHKLSVPVASPGSPQRRLSIISPSVVPSRLLCVDESENKSSNTFMTEEVSVRPARPVAVILNKRRVNSNVRILTNALGFT